MNLKAPPAVNSQEQHLTHEQIRAMKADEKKRMVRKLLALGYDMKWHKPRNATEGKMIDWKINMKHINEFMLSEKGAVKKEINAMTHRELSTAITQLEQVYKDYLKHLNRYMGSSHESNITQNSPHPGE